MPSFKLDAENDLVVKTTSGVVEGIASWPLGYVREFLGIPFGRPPVGNLRFREPQPNEPWNGTRSAKHYAPDCMQHHKQTDAGVSEDWYFFL